MTSTARVQPKRPLKEGSHAERLRDTHVCDEWDGTPGGVCSLDRPCQSLKRLLRKPSGPWVAWYDGSPLMRSTPKTDPEYWADRGREFQAWAAEREREQRSKDTPAFKQAVKDLRDIGLTVMLDVGANTATAAYCPIHDGALLDIRGAGDGVRLSCRAGCNQEYDKPDEPIYREIVTMAKPRILDFRSPLDEAVVESITKRKRKTAPHLKAVPDDDVLSGLKTGEWLDAQTFDPLRYVVPGLVPEGVTLLVGAPKIGKSWLSLDLALAVASGDRALGGIEIGEPRPVLLLALEDGDRRLQDRARHLRPGQPIPPLLSYLKSIKNQPAAYVIKTWLDRRPEDEPPPLVIVDVLGKVMPEGRKGENSYIRDYNAMGDLKEVCDERPGTSLLILHHDRKSEANDFVDSVSGTHGIAGAADTIVLIRRQRTEGDALLLVTGRDVREGEYAVTMEHGRWRLAGDDLDEAAAAARAARSIAKMSDRSAEIIQFASSHPEGVRSREVADHTGMEPVQAGVYLNRLEAAGKIVRLKRGLYGPA